MTTAARIAAPFAAVLSTLSLVACDDADTTPAEGVTVDHDNLVMNFKAEADPSAIPPEPLDPVEQMPDLVIDATAGSTVGIIGDYWFVQFRVKNRGNKAAAASKAGVLLLDDWNHADPNGVHTGNIPSLAPGAGAWVTINFASADIDIPGYEDLGWDIYNLINYKTRQIADATQLVAESSETNNSYTIAW